MNSQEIILIADKRILAIPVRDSEDPLVDLRTYKEFLVDARRSEDSETYYKVRKSVAEKLCEASKRLTKGVRFLIIEGHRALSLQGKYFDEYSQELKKSYPDWSEERVREEASKYVAPPDIMPPHSTGGAIDLTLVDAKGNELDMGTLVNADPEVTKNACFTSTSNINKVARQNRQALIDALSNAGFVNYPTEWWHWSYGDRYWGYNKGESALFGSID